MAGSLAPRSGQPRTAGARSVSRAGSPARARASAKPRRRYPRARARLMVPATAESAAAPAPPEAAVCPTAPPGAFPAWEQRNRRRRRPRAHAISTGFHVGALVGALAAPLNTAGRSSPRTRTSAAPLGSLGGLCGSPPFKEKAKSRTGACIVGQTNSGQLSANRDRRRNAAARCCCPRASLTGAARQPPAALANIERRDRIATPRRRRLVELPDTSTIRHSREKCSAGQDGALRKRWSSTAAHRREAWALAAPAGNVVLHAHRNAPTPAQHDHSRADPYSGPRPSPSVRARGAVEVRHDRPSPPSVPRAPRPIPRAPLLLDARRHARLQKVETPPRHASPADSPSGTSSVPPRAGVRARRPRRLRRPRAPTETSPYEITNDNATGRPRTQWTSPS